MCTLTLEVRVCVIVENLDEGFGTIGMVFGNGNK